MLCALCAVFTLSCTSVTQTKTITIHTTAYPPFTNDDNTGLLIELVQAAFLTQGIQAEFILSDIEKAYALSLANETLMLCSRDVEFNGVVDDDHFVELYESHGYMLHIAGRKDNGIVGVFAPDEEAYAKSNNLNYVKYNSYKQGLSLLYKGDVSKVFCAGIGCDQIVLSNPELQFVLEEVYTFPFDVVYYGDDIPKPIQSQMASLAKGIEAILKSGEYLKILEAHKIQNPMYTIPLETLLKFEINQHLDQRDILVAH